LRTKEINNWIEKNSKKLERWVVLVDMDMNIKNFVRKNYKIGLSEEDADEAISILMYLN